MTDIINGDGEGDGDGDGVAEVRAVHEVHGVRGLNPRENDQFFTSLPVAKHCVDLLQNSLTVKITDFDLVLEPSFGTGAFVSALMFKGGVDPARMKYIDIDAFDEAARKDFLQSTKEIIPPDFFHCKKADASKKRDHATMTGKTCLTIGNPPFGKNASTAVAFFNTAAKFSSVIAFIVPRTFAKESVKDRLDRNFFLVKQELLEENSFIFEGKPCNVPCIFQVWIHCSHMNMSEKSVLIPEGELRPVQTRIASTSDFVFVKASDDPHLAIRRVGVNAGRIFVETASQCSEQSHFFIRIKDEHRLEEVLARLRSLELEKINVKYDTAGCPSISKNELCVLYNATQ